MGFVEAILEDAAHARKQGGVKSPQKERTEFHSPLEGESKRPSGFCEGRFGGG